MKNLIFVVLVGLLLNISPAVADNWEVGIIAGSISHHVDQSFAPKEGYNEDHHTFGFEFSQNKDGIIYGGSVAKFKDSFNQDSKFALATVEAKWSFDYLSLSSGGGFGYLKTSYYEGAIAVPFVKIRENNSGLYLKLVFQPIQSNIEKLDRFTAVTFGISTTFDL